MKKKSSAEKNSAIDLLEEAVQLLRTAPASLCSAYAVGTLPFVLAFLYFWADMSHGAFAAEHASPAALSVALLFIWMKCWHVVFASGLRALRTRQPSAPWTAQRVWRMVVEQAALQPSGLFLLPVALVIFLPFGWAFAFYQNLTALGGETVGLRELCRAAARQASTRPGQNHLMQALLSVFLFFVWLNVVTVMAMLPHLLKMLTGVETAFTQSGMAGVFNTTFLASSVALTYLVVDPIYKATFVLRCFYGQSLQSGEDLKSDLARARSAAGMAAATLAVLVLCAPRSANAATPAPAPPVQVAPETLNQSINEVLQRPEFAWRMPREERVENEADKSWFSRGIDAVVDMMQGFAKSCLHSLGECMKWLEKMLRKLWTPSGGGSSGTLGESGWVAFLRAALVVLITAIACILAILITRLWLNRRQISVLVATPVRAQPDLNDENVAADQLPEDGWLKMARELMAQGNLRLALRAFYLAGLASLAARELISLATFKSNREYESELRRRGRAQPAVQTAFSRNVATFDRAWYGLHEVTLDDLRLFQSNLDQIRS